MIYIIQGNEKCFIEEKINQICSDCNNILRLDASKKDFDVKELVENCNSNSLFSDSIILLVQNPYFLINKVDDNIAKIIMNYVEHPNYETELVFYTYENSFNNKLKLFKDIANNAQLIICDSLDYKNFNSYLLSELANYSLKLDRDCITLLANLCKRNATLLKQNLEILSLYPGECNPEIIKSLCTSSDENNSFDLINCIIKKDVSGAITLERKLLKENDSLNIIYLLASQLRNLYCISFLKKNNVSNSEIAKQMNYTDYRLKMALQVIENLSSSKILWMLKQLKDLDELNKSENSISDVSRFEIFILNLLKKDNDASDKTTI